ncbi:DUF2523 domain-containing protein [Sphingomonas sp. NCPPB 2930]
MLLNLSRHFVFQALVGLGVSVVTYKGVDTSLGFLKSQAVTAFQGLPADVLGMLSLMKVGVCISIITSALAARLTAKGLNGAVKRFVKK